jgi:hypothetical protein
MAIKYTNTFQSKALQNLPNLDFWFEKKPSGNPGVEQHGATQKPLFVSLDLSGL